MVEAIQEFRHSKVLNSLSCFKSKSLSLIHYFLIQLQHECSVVVLFQGQGLHYETFEKIPHTGVQLNNLSLLMLSLLLLLLLPTSKGASAGGDHRISLTNVRILKWKNFDLLCDFLPVLVSLGPSDVSIKS